MDKKEQNQVVVKENVIEEVSKQIELLQKKGKLMLAPNYSATNALMSAWLILQETVDRNRNPVLSSCTRSSIVNSLLDLIIQGLNPMKKQCYFIAYGRQLTCMRSYFGSMAIVKNICGAKDVYGEVIYQGDEFVYEIHNGNKQILKHVQEFGNVDVKNIVGAYCTITFDDQKFTEIMTLEQIHKSWQKSKIDTMKVGSTHQEFPEEMCKRTVINRACKRYINSSSDNAVLLEAMSRADEISTDEEMDEEIGEKANQEVIDIEPKKETQEQENKPEDVQKKVTLEKEEGTKEPKTNQGKESQLFEREPEF